VGVWFSGAWHTTTGDNYSAQVQSVFAGKPWLSWPNQG
jgi:hypothetical protein